MASFQFLTKNHIVQSVDEWYIRRWMSFCHTFIDTINIPLQNDWWQNHEQHFDGRQKYFDQENSLQEGSHIVVEIPNHLKDFLK